METQVPSWLGESPITEKTDDEIRLPLSVELRRANLALAHQTFDLIFEDTLDRLTAGHLLSDIIIDYNESHPIKIEGSKFQQWIFRDKDRKKRYDEAMELGTHVTLDEMIRIADGRDNPMEDVQRSLVRIKVRERKLKAYNRRVFGDDSSAVGGGGGGPITINIGAVESPYAKPIPKADVVDVTPRIENE